MWLNRLNTRIAAEVGGTLADHFVAVAPKPGAGRPSRPVEQRRAIQAFLARIDSDARPLRLGMFGRAKLVSSFKGRLLDSGVERNLAEELSRMLVLRLSNEEPERPPAADTATAADPRPESNSVRSLLVEADAAAARGAHAEVIEIYQQLLKIKPRHLLARNNLGVAFWKLGRYKEATEQFRRATGIQSTFADAQFNLGTLLRLTGQVAESEMPLRRALKLDPRHVEAQVSLGLTLVMLGRLDDARDCFEKALKVAPRHTGASVGMGKVASLEGRFDEAETQYKRALEVDSNSTGAWAALVDLRRMTSSDGAWLKSAEQVVARGLDPLQEADLRFAMGKYFDDTGDAERAFKNYKRANELQKSIADRYDADGRERFVDDMIRVYTREVLAAGQPGGSDSKRPIFVVGMMRSGTSLVEQILAAHPSVHGAGELPFWYEVAHRHEAILRSRPPGEPLQRKLSDAYLRILDSVGVRAPRVVDKSTFNSDLLGVIHSVLPNARFLYVKRDPIDTCLSCYFNQFSSAQSFTYDLADLAHYYREHSRLVAHWRNVLPAGTMMDVPYAELVEDQERWTRRMLDFLGLEWDERCLEFHTAERPVLTASFWQVRQKVYKRSVGRWHRYEKFIGPLRELRDQ